MKKYLTYSQYIDWHEKNIIDKAAELASNHASVIDIAKACFEFVRDEIKHSWDYALNPVTCKASDVLKQGTGFCYAKSHLLAALLRANNIPAGLCYQRLTISNDEPPFCLHGLNAMFIAPYGWYRVDARGNKGSVKAEFIPPIEKLAFPIVIEGEIDFTDILSEPLDVIVTLLVTSNTYLDVANNLPDAMSIR